MPVRVDARRRNRAIAAGKTVYIVEGEKDADNLLKTGLVGTCNAGGAGKWQASHSKWLEGAKVIILPDNDDAQHRRRPSRQTAP